MPTPTSTDFLTVNSFKFGIQKYPELNYYVTDVSLPSINLGESIQATSVHDIKLPGDTLTFSDLDIQFYVDSNLANYIAIQDWMFGIGAPYSSAQFKDFLNSSKNVLSRSHSSKMVSDCFLSILDSSNNTIKQFTFVDAFPTNLSAITMSTTAQDAQYVVGNLTLSYVYYKIAV